MYDTEHLIGALCKIQLSNEIFSQEFINLSAYSRLAQKACKLIIVYKLGKR